MKEFEVTITETLEKKITVEALSKDEAEQAVRDMWNDADIILDAEDFIDVDFNTDDGKELSAVNESKKLDVLLVEPGQYARMTTIDAGLESLQKTVGGDMEAGSITAPLSTGEPALAPPATRRPTPTATTQKQRSIPHTAALSTATGSIAPPVRPMSALSAMRTTRSVMEAGRITRRHSTDG